MLIAQMIGGLVPTILVSRLTLLLVRRDNRHKFPHLTGAHGLSLVLCALLFGFGSGEGGFDARVANMFGAGLVAGLYLYAIPQAFWLVAEYFRRRGQRA